jgi:hypothetical protein
MGPRYGAAVWGCGMGPRYGAAVWGRGMGPRYGACKGEGPTAADVTGWLKPARRRLKGICAEKHTLAAGPLRARWACPLHPAYTQPSAHL